MSGEEVVCLNGPQSKTARAFESKNPTVNREWGRGIGKSWDIRSMVYRKIARYDGIRRPSADLPGIRTCLLMPTFNACKKVHADKLVAELTGPWAYLGGKVNRSEWKVSFPGGSTFQMLGMLEANANRGLRMDHVEVDECDDVDPDKLDAVVSPWFSEVWSIKELGLGGTPRRGRHGLLWQKHLDGVAGNIVRKCLRDGTEIPEAYQARAKALRHSVSFHATYRDAPETADAEHVATVRADMEARGKLNLFQREWECSYLTAAGLVYPMWDESFHVREPDPRTRWTEILVGGDHGWSDPGVFEIIAVAGHGADAECHVIDEVYAEQQIESWWIEKAREIVQRPAFRGIPMRWYLDPSRPDRVEALRKGAGIRVEQVNNAIEDGVSAVADRLSIRRIDRGEQEERRFAKLYVSSKCKALIREMSQYRYVPDTKNEDVFLERIEDKHNHCEDSIRYPLLSRFGGPSRTRSESGAGW